MHIGFWKRSAAGLVGALVLSGPLVGFLAAGAPDVTAGAAAGHSVTAPASINFNSVTLGDIYEQQFAVTNDGDAPATVGGATYTGDVDDFEVLPDASCPSSTRRPT